MSYETYTKNPAAVERKVPWVISLLLVVFIVLMLCAIAQSATPEWWRQEISVQHALFSKNRPDLPNDFPRSESPPPEPAEPEPVQQDQEPCQAKEPEGVQVVAAGQHKPIDCFVMISYPGCEPCLKWKRQEIPILQRATWVIGPYSNTARQHVHLVELPLMDAMEKDGQIQRDWSRLMLSLPKNWEELAPRCVNGEIFEMTEKAEYGVDRDFTLHVPLWLGYRAGQKMPAVVFVGYRTAAELRALRRGDPARATAFAAEPPPRTTIWQAPIFRAPIVANWHKPLNVGAQVSAGPLFRTGFGRNGLSYGLELFPKRGTNSFSMGFWTTGR